MSFAKFMALLDTGALFFCPIRKFIDEYEGFIHEGFFDEFHKLMFPIYDSDEQKTLWTVEHVKIHILDCCYVSCWCISEDEHKSMWDGYVGSCPGVAIKTKSDVLVNYIKKQYHGQVLSGPVRYADHEDDVPIRLQHPLMKKADPLFVMSQKDNPPEIIGHIRDYTFVFQKCKHFEYESEFRLVALEDHGIDFDSWENWARSDIGVEYGTLAVLNDFYVENEEQIRKIRNTKTLKGIETPFRVDEVAEKILISPDSPSWFPALVRKMLIRFGMSGIGVENSTYK